MLKRLLFFALFIFSLTTLASVKLPKILGSNMVLKQNTSINIWGWSTTGKTITLQANWEKRKYVTKCDGNGKWKFTIKTPKAGGPYQMVIDDGEKTILDNILIGEVWLCSGQSNMSMPLNGFSAKQNIKDAGKIIANAENQNLRLFTVKEVFSNLPKDDCSGEWSVSTPQVARGFSAVAYQFGSMLQQHLKVPVGIIHASVGGTPIRDWMGESFDQFAEMYPSAQSDAENRRPRVFFNGMIYPLKDFKISGFLWYQGEADRGKHDLYQKMLPEMVKEWRSLWNNRKLGFYQVQIAPWTYPDDKGVLKSPYMRTAQFELTQRIKNSGIAITADVGSDQSIHPPDKTTVAERLLKIALAKTYKQTLNYRGPEFSSLKIFGPEAFLKFKFGDGLIFKENSQANFEIAGADKVFHPAKAKIEGNFVVVEAKQVQNPVAVRYCFKDYFVGNLYNADGLPAVPFRTDNW